MNTLRFLQTLERAPKVRLGAWLLGGLILAWGPAGRLSAQTPGVAETYREAYDLGFKEGRSSGIQDRRSGIEFDFRSKKVYQEASLGLSESRHDRTVYTVAFRRGFEDGYEEGFNAGPNAAATVAARHPAPPPEPPPPPASEAATAAPPSARAVQTIPAGTLVVVELMETLSTKYNERGDRFTSRVLEDVRLAGATVIPKESQVVGSVSYLKRAGRIRGRAQISLRFEELQLPDGRTLPIEAALVDLEAGSEERVSESEGAIVAPPSKGRDASQVGQASGVGALVGVISGGKQGAGVGAAAGAVAGLATVLVTRGRDAVLESRTQLTIRVTSDLRLSPESP